MDTLAENRQKDDWSYYYALYHMLAHWAAFLALFVLLVTLGVQWNTPRLPRVAHSRGAALGLVVLGLVEIQLLRCLWKENKYLLRKLPLANRAPELVEWLLHKNPWLTFSLAVLATVAFTAWDVLLVFNW